MNEQLQKAKDAAYYYLSFRARSVKEVRDKLVQQDCAAEIVAQVLAAIQAAGFNSAAIVTDSNAG